jgi:hypothetical protein
MARLVDNDWLKNAIYLCLAAFFTSQVLGRALPKFCDQCSVGYNNYLLRAWHSKNVETTLN